MRGLSKWSPTPSFDDHTAHDACYVHFGADNHDRGEDDDCHDNHDGNSPPIRSHTFQKLQFRWKVGDLDQFHRWFKRLSILSVLA